MDFAKGFDFSQAIGPNYLGGIMDSSARTAIHFSHRIGAIIVTLAVICLALKLQRLRGEGLESPSLWAKSLIAVLILQLALGLSNIIWSLPLSVAVAHNAVGALLLVTLVGLGHRIYTVSIKRQ